jgi:hypothetical protein
MRKNLIACLAEIVNSTSIDECWWEATEAAVKILLVWLLFGIISRGS